MPNDVTSAKITLIFLLFIVKYRCLLQYVKLLLMVYAEAVSSDRQNKLNVSS